MNLDEFFFEQPDEFVVLLDGLHRLDKHGLSAGACAVDDALYAAFLLDLDWDDEALAADGDEFVLNRAAFGEMAQISAERFLDGAALLFNVAADACQFG